MANGHLLAPSTEVLPVRWRVFHIRSELHLGPFGPSCEPLARRSFLWSDLHVQRGGVRHPLATQTAAIESPQRCAVQHCGLPRRIDKVEQVMTETCRQHVFKFNWSEGLIM